MLVLPKGFEQIRIDKTLYIKDLNNSCLQKVYRETSDGVEQAIALLKTNSNCFNCVNCVRCIDCANCENLSHVKGVDHFIIDEATYKRMNELRMYKTLNVDSLLDSYMNVFWLITNQYESTESSKLMHYQNLKDSFRNIILSAKRI